MLIKLMIRFFKGFFGADIPSPSDIVPSEHILYYETTQRAEICLGVTKPEGTYESYLDIPFTNPPFVWIPPIPDTNSMDPVFDARHNNILVAGRDAENKSILVNWLAEQKPGNIAVYKSDSKYIIHRVSKVGEDGKGRYFKFRSDRLLWDDSPKVRDDEIKWVSIGTIY